MIPGAHYKNNKCDFNVWVPKAAHMALKWWHNDQENVRPMHRTDKGCWSVTIEPIAPNTRYMYRLDDAMDRPDPAAHFQPDSVHNPSAVVDHDAFQWEEEGWTGIPLAEMIMYELHVGTFTREGTFEAVIPWLDELLELGVNAIELLPVAQFPGNRNWGYDGVYPYAVQNTYGGPAGLKKLVNACHQKGLAVILDVVYNHIGPEGNYLGQFGHYFTGKYHGAWGEVINFDGAYSDEVRTYFIENAVHWFRNYHFDILRLDAVHGILDFSARPFLQDLQERIEQITEEDGRRYDLIAESDLNDTRIIRSREEGGFNISAQWSDDFHHAVHSLLTGEKAGYYQDYGELLHLVKAMNDGFVLDGWYSHYRLRRHGNSSEDRPGEQFVVFIQNHDQVGNRMLGERLSQLVSFEAQKLAAGAMLLSPYIPMLFMGEEYGEDNPFQYFISHTDPDLVEAVRQGRQRDFESFQWDENVPDPQDEATFERSRLDRSKRHRDSHQALWNYYRFLIDLRRTHPALRYPDKDKAHSFQAGCARTLALQRKGPGCEVLALMNFQADAAEVALNELEGSWAILLDSTAQQWHGPGSDIADLEAGINTFCLPSYALIVWEKKTDDK